MKLQRRVVVTGLGLVTPLGNDVSSSWDACTNGISGISTFNNSIVDSPVSIGGRIKDLDLSLYLDAKESRRLDTFIQYGVVAASQAITDSGFLDSSTDLTRAGVNFGSGIGGIETIENNHKLYLEKGYKKVSPFMVPGSIINMTSGLISIKFGLKGSNVSTVTACSSGNHCIGLAARSIAYGESDIMVAGGSEMASTPLAISGFIAARALSTSSNPATASRPWDVDRDGFVLSDGAGAIILEDLEHAQKRNAKIYAEIIGFGMSSDAFHMTAPPEDGKGAALSMANAISDSEINSNDIDYINAHGTSTPLGDLAEATAMKSIFKEDIPAISSTKSMTGHTLGAAGAIESIFSILSINNNVIPPTINLDNQDPRCDLDFTPLTARESEITIAMNNSFGFGGTNSTLIFRQYFPF
ncbi:MAG: beta-ketoacyl-ACP synthase II [SAR86 cluster bacterium]|jgi:3-oxoacyl-[acyl-carrier-protein] synthase II|nr:beta-ketoacyl-ACP synthase II [SAR86 cluster bacterium]|tara:strand:+ start:3328 stop:4566 length:1239 start_codon:yes stop_codon:yes gene_type:complete